MREVRGHLVSALDNGTSKLAAQLLVKGLSFLKLALCGWVVGPLGSGQVGHSLRNKRIQRMKLQKFIIFYQKMNVKKKPKNKNQTLHLFLMIAY